VNLAQLFAGCNQHCVLLRPGKIHAAQAAGVWDSQLSSNCNRTPTFPFTHLVSAVAVDLSALMPRMRICS
jgi:hypothetical protein